MKLNNIISVIISMFTVIALGIIVWGTNKGFDLTDEGYYMLGYTNPYENWPKLTFFHMVGSILFGWLDPGILGYRIIRLILTIFSSVVFASGFIKWIKATGIYTAPFIINSRSIYAFVLLGSLISYSIYPQTLSYNTLTLILLQLSVGLFFYAISSSDRSLSVYDKIHWKLILIG
ncbi:hypothetical protein JYT51_02490, partial [Candidatus Amoebophilus asiaticus]|nr:hypothetical protein [Candidatus Amoebophilus asiaticus]